MPQQNDFSEGPFSQQLTQPYQAPHPPITGYEGPAAAIAHIATNFLEGASQSRMRKFQMQEQQRQGGIKALGSLMQMSQGMGLTPAAQAEFVRNVSQEYLKQVANADTGEKGAKGGNPMANFFKGMATNLLGGPSPVKVKPIDENYIGGVFNQLQSLPKAADIHKQASELFYKGLNEVKTGTPLATEADYINNPNVSQAFQLLESHGMTEPMTNFKLAIGTALPTPKDARSAIIFNEMRNAATPPQPAPSQEEPPTPAGATPTAAPASNVPYYLRPNEAVQSAPAEQPGIAPTPAPQQSAGRRALTSRESMLYNFGKTYDNYATPDGKIFSGVEAFNGITGQPAGIYDPATRELHSDVQKTGPIPQPPALRQSTPEQRTQFLARATATIDGSKDKIIQQYASMIKDGIQRHVDRGDLDGANAFMDGITTAAMNGDRAQTRQLLSINLRNSGQSLDGLSKAQQQAVKTFSQQFERHPVVAGYRNAEMNYDQVIGNLHNVKMTDLGVTQSEILRLFARLTHPNQRVTDTEVKMYLSHMGVLPRFEQFLKTGFTKGGWMTPQAKMAFETMAQEVMKAQEKQFGQVYNTYALKAKAFGVDPSLITGTGWATMGGGSEPPAPNGALKPNQKYNPATY